MSGYSKLDVLAAREGKTTDEYVLALLNEHKNAGAVARELGMNRQTFYSWLQRRGFHKTTRTVWKKAKN